MCNVRRLALFLFLVFGSGLIPLADADACHRRGRRAQSCCQATVLSDGCEQRGFVLEDTRGIPTISGYLYDKNGYAVTERVTITVYNTPEGLTTGGIMGQNSLVPLSTGYYSITCDYPPLPNGLMIIVYQRGYPSSPIGTPTKIAVGGGSSNPHKINPVMQP